MEEAQRAMLGVLLKSFEGRREHRRRVPHLCLERHAGHHVLRRHGEGDGPDGEAVALEARDGAHATLGLGGRLDVTLHPRRPWLAEELGGQGGEGRAE